MRAVLSILIQTGPILRVRRSHHLDAHFLCYKICLSPRRRYTGNVHSGSYFGKIRRELVSPEPQRKLKEKMSDRLDWTW